MPIVQIKTHSTRLIYEAVKQMVQAHGFIYNDDLSETEIGTLKKEFKIIFGQVVNTGRSNLQNLRVRATIEFLLYHNAEGDTEQAKLRASDDIENLVFEIERFAPIGTFESVKALVAVTELKNWLTEAIKGGDDSRLRSVIEYEIEYIIRNPNA